MDRRSFMVSFFRSTFIYLNRVIGEQNECLVFRRFLELNRSLGCRVCRGGCLYLFWFRVLREENVYVCGWIGVESWVSVVRFQVRKVVLGNVYIVCLCVFCFIEIRIQRDVFIIKSNGKYVMIKENVSFFYCQGLVGSGEDCGQLQYTYFL